MTDEPEVLDLDVAPPEPTFWETYSPRFEMPMSWLIALLSHLLIVATLILLLVVAMRGADTKPVPIALVDGGYDESGSGSPGSGGVNDPLAVGNSAPAQTDFAALPNQANLPQVKDDLQKKIQVEDPSATNQLNDEKAAAYAALDEAVRNKLLNIGQQKGAGPGDGRGDSGQQGTGPGGTGADSTRARSLRWILRFTTRGGRDYIDQLKALGAKILVPMPPDNAKAYIFRDLDNPKPGEFVTESEWKQLSNQIQFCDFKRDTVRDVAAALGLDFAPSAFWAFFPKELEAELSRLEVAYRNRRPEDIEETVFEVTIREGRFVLVVKEQRAKR